MNEYAPANDQRAAQAAGNEERHATRLADWISDAVPDASIESPLLSFGVGAARRPRDAAVDKLRQLKLQIHNRLFEKLDVVKLRSLDSERAAAKITATIIEVLEEEDRLLTEADRERLIDEMRNELLGLGPLEPLIHDEKITDILVNGAKDVWIERNGKLIKTKVSFYDDQHLMVIIDRIVSRVGRRVDSSSPMVDARLPDGSRINAIIPPLAIDGPALSIRRFGHKRFEIEDLVAKESIAREMVQFLNAVVRARLNILVVGGTGSGKTTMLNCLSGFIPEDERIVTIEDSAELSLQQPHVVRLE
ncbi:MAG: ATPase, T2SS/T4P/T4SS family, partial [Candidatus Binataceae bacterium]